MLRIFFLNVVDYLKVYERVVFVEEFAPFTKRMFSHQSCVALLSSLDWSRLPPDISALGLALLARAAGRKGPYAHVHIPGPVEGDLVGRKRCYLIFRQIQRA